MKEFSTLEDDPNDGLRVYVDDQLMLDCKPSAWRSAIHLLTPNAVIALRGGAPAEQDVAAEHAAVVVDRAWVEVE